MGACVLCEQQITNPLGPARLTQQLTAWLEKSNPGLTADVHSVAGEVTTNEGTDLCIVTKTPMNVCAYCFTQHIYDWLVANNQPDPLMREFMTYFDFDAERQGYYKDALRRGYVE